LFKASWHLKDKSKNKKLSKAQNPSQALHEDDNKNLKKWSSLAKQRREQQKKLDLAVFFIFMIKDNLGKIYL